VDHVYFYNNVRPLDRFCMRLVKVPYDDVVHELDRRKAVQRREEERKEKARLRREKLAEQRKLMKEVGVLFLRVIPPLSITLSPFLF
jgi:hypothetical protein